MSIYGPSPIKRKPRLRRTRVELENLDISLASIVEEIEPATVRQVFYQAVVRGLAMEANEGSAVIEETTYRTQARTEAAPLVTPDGSRLLARRPGRELFPASWLRHRAAVSYEGGDITGTLLEYCSVGLIVATREGKTLVSWDALQVVELRED